MEEIAKTLELLLLDADEKRPVLEGGIPREIVGRAPKPDEKLPKILDNRSGDPADLEEQRWGVIAPEGSRGDRLLSLIDPLIRARRKEQGAKVEIYRVPPRMTAEQVSAWRDGPYSALPPEDTPRYLLILGDLDEVSMEIQQFVSLNVFLGRLAFSKDAEYEAYVQKVLRWEKTPPKAPPRALFYTARDGTTATSIAYSALMKPTVALAQERKKKNKFPIREIVEIQDDDPKLPDLLETVSAPDPALLFTISHGLGVPRRGWKSADQQRKMQGAMGLGGGEAITGDDARSGPFLPGGVWFFLACYGAGTPSESVYATWLHRLQEAGLFEHRVDQVLAGLPKPGDRPFIAHLPSAALANPDGPLAVISHIDLAWSYSFQDTGARVMNRSRRYQDIFRSLADGGRAGMAHSELIRYVGEAQTDLMTRYGAMEERAQRGAPIEETPAKAAERANLWMLRHDLLGYIVLGDPAVRIPGAGKPVEREAPPERKAMLNSVFGGLGIAVKTSRLEDRLSAVQALLEKTETAEQAASRLGVSKGDVKRWLKAYEDAGTEALRKL